MDRGEGTSWLLGQVVAMAMTVAGRARRASVGLLGSDEAAFGDRLMNGEALVAACP
jgi:hypothetical protein